MRFELAFKVLITVCMFCRNTIPKYTGLNHQNQSNDLYSYFSKIIIWRNQEENKFTKELESNIGNITTGTSKNADIPLIDPYYNLFESDKNDDEEFDFQYLDQEWNHIHKPNIDHAIIRNETSLQGGRILTYWD